MNRRAFLVSTGAVSGSLLAGCINEVGRTEYEECSQTIILMENLPDDVDEEVTAALEEGSYETDGNLYLTDIMDSDSSYLRADPDDSDGPPWTRIYYQPVIEPRDGTMELRLEETIPTERGTISISNSLGEDAEVHITVEYEPYSDSFDDEILVDDDFEIPTGQNARLVSGDIGYGSYSATIKFPSEKEEVEARWGLRMGNRLPNLILSKATGKKQVKVQQAVSDMRYCKWDEAGEVTY